MPTITRVQVPGTKTPVGHYSQAIVANGLVFVSGQTPSDLRAGTHVTGSIEEQTERSLLNVKDILEAAGSGLEYAVQMTIFISRIEDWGQVNTTYARIMGAAKPTRAIVPVAPLHYGTGIEIQCVAILPPKRKPAARAPRRKPSTRRPSATKRRPRR
jgi:2-iminobutanoate/2-iminopropanoate deaminase